MTAPAPATIEREKDKLYLTDAELIRRLGVPDKTLRPMLPALESKYGFPRKSPLFGDRRYWPAVKAWLDKHNGLMVDPSNQARPTWGQDQRRSTLLSASITMATTSLEIVAGRQWKSRTKTENAPLSNGERGGET